MSDGAGADAARADLARFGKDVAESSVHPNQKKAAVRVFQAGEAVLNAVRTYDIDHPTLERTIDGMLEKLTEYWDAYGELNVRLDARSLWLEEEVVHTAERAEDNTWFPLFSAGIRRLTFSPTRSGVELRLLFKILNKFRKGQDDAFDEDDPVTQLWVLELKSIRYVAVDSYSALLESGSAIANELRRMADINMLAEMSSVDLRSQLRQTMTRATQMTLTKRELDFVKEENLGALEELPPEEEGEQNVFHLTTEETSHLAKEHEGDAEDIARYVEALLFAVQELSDPERRLALLNVLCGRFEACLEERQFAMAGRIIRRLGDAEEAGENLVRQATTPRGAKIVVEAFAAADGEQLTVLLGLVPYFIAEVDTVLATVPGVADKEVRTMLLKIIACWGEEAATAIGKALPDAKDAYAYELVEILGEMDVQSARVALGQVAGHESHRVRSAAYKGLFSLDDDIARSNARAALEDEHSLVRLLALEFCARARFEEARAWIQELVDDPNFKDLELAEKRRLYKALAGVGGKEVIPWLLDKLSQSNRRFSKPIDHERIAAAFALAFLRAEEARDVLEKLEDSRFVRKEIREAAEKALDLMEEPPEPVLPIPSKSRRRPRLSDIGAVVGTGEFAATTAKTPATVAGHPAPTAAGHPPAHNQTTPQPAPTAAGHPPAYNLTTPQPAPTAAGHPPAHNQTAPQPAPTPQSATAPQAFAATAHHQALPTAPSTAPPTQRAAAAPAAPTMTPEEARRALAAQRSPQSEFGEPGALGADNPRTTVGPAPVGPPVPVPPGTGAAGNAQPADGGGSLLGLEFESSTASFLNADPAAEGTEQTMALDPAQPVVPASPRVPANARAAAGKPAPAPNRPTTEVVLEAARKVPREVLQSGEMPPHDEFGDTGPRKRRGTNPMGSGNLQTPKDKP